MRTQLQLAEKAASRARAEKPDASAVFGVPEFARDVPPLNIVIQIIGSRGDVQPFIALGQVLKNQYGHRVRVATHPTFKKFVIENGLEFYSIGGDPAELVSFSFFFWVVGKEGEGANVGVWGGRWRLWLRIRG